MDDIDRIDLAIRRTREIIGNQSIEHLSHGMEGAIFTDGEDAYKYFHAGKSTFQDGQLNFLKEKFLGRHLEHFAQLKAVYEEGDELVFRMELLDGNEYSGGYLGQIRGLLKECMEQGIAYRNIHPKNILVCGEKVKICDIGRSILPMTSSEYREMAKRAYLTYRFHFRQDLAELMTTALNKEAIPTLFGFQHFWNSLADKPGHIALDRLISSIVGDVDNLDILDCVHGGLSLNISKENHELDDLLKSKREFDRILYDLDTCATPGNSEVGNVLRTMRGLLKHDGEAIVIISNPFDTFVRETETHRKAPSPTATYTSEFRYEKCAKRNPGVQAVVHRQYESLLRQFLRNGLRVANLYETPETDFDSLAPASDYLVVELELILLPPKRNVSLLIKASPIEWQTIEFQIKHIVRQLDTPSQFSEVIVVTDRHDGPFLRQYALPNHERLLDRLMSLKEEGWIDKVVVAPGDPTEVRNTYRKWFGIESTETHSENGQHTYTTLFGFDRCNGDYVLQMDSDCIIVRKDLNHDFIGEMITEIERDPKVLTVPFKIAEERTGHYTHSDGEKEWRTEVRCSLFKRERLVSVLPLPNSLNSDGKLRFPWHRALDQMISGRNWHSCRGGDSRVFFIHIQNSMKNDANLWYNIIKQAESGRVPSAQYANADLYGTIEDWFAPRTEEFIFIVRGRNVDIPRIRRMLRSIDVQHLDSYGIVFIDADSVNGMEEYIENIALSKYANKASFWRNWSALTPIENTKIAISRLCGNPHSVMITLDADDALIGENVLDSLKICYDQGADLTVGSMLRTDKEKEYPVDFLNPRRSRGGNVWQHLRTFRKGLFDSIPENYFKIDGNWIPHTEDWAFMLPMVDIAGKPVRVKDYLYFYEPSPLKNERSLEEMEGIIGRIINKPIFQQGG